MSTFAQLEANQSDFLQSINVQIYEGTLFSVIVDRDEVYYQDYSWYVNDFNWIIISFLLNHTEYIYQPSRVYKTHTSVL